MITKKSFTPFIYIISIIIITAIAISCNKEEKAPVTKDKVEKTEAPKEIKTSSGTGISSAGKELFYKKSTENNIACADCHSDGTNNGNLLTKFFSNIQGANKRTSTFQGLITGEEVIKTAGGATLCWESYEKMKTPLTEAQIKSLNDYYASVETTNSPAEIKYETIALPKKDKAKLKEVQKTIMGLKGDPVKGEQSFKNTCGFCHGENSTIKKVPTILEDFDGNIKSIVYNVRLGNGPMPFFHAPSLTDQEIADISAYVMKKNGK
jgi:mono/diheme cytochrome c family protein